MKKLLLTAGSAFAFIILSTFIAGATGSAGSMNLSAQVMKPIKKAVTAVADKAEDVGDVTKNRSKTVYRRGAVVGNRVWTGSKWVGRSAWRGGTWVAVKGKNGTKWVYHKGRNVVAGAKKPVP
jgi:hypothetical protein